jgi:hypothetical protein
MGKVIVRAAQVVNLKRVLSKSEAFSESRVCLLCRRRRRETVILGFLKNFSLRAGNYETVEENYDVILADLFFAGMLEVESRRQ